MENRGSDRIHQEDKNDIQAHSLFKEKCVDSMTDGYSVFSEIYTKEGQPVASKAVTFDATTLAPHVVIDFSNNGKNYELWDDLKSPKEVFIATTGSDGKQSLSKIDPASPEYKTAVDAADNLGFNKLPSCSSVISTI